jgi:hypothetical protein
MVNSLIKRGLVKKTRGEVDKRCRYIELTPAGKAITARFFRIHVRSGFTAKYAARMLIDVPAKPAKIEQMLALAKDFKHALRDRSYFQPDMVYPEEMDDGAPLDPPDKRIYDRIVRYGEARFRHLPFEYLMYT